MSSSRDSFSSVLLSLKKNGLTANNTTRATIITNITLKLNLNSTKKFSFLG